MIDLRAASANIYNAAREDAARHRTLLLYSGAFLVYVFISLWMTGMIGHSLTGSMLNESGDPNGYLFFLKWWPWTILHGHNPFVVRGLTYPVPYNAAWITSVGAPSLLAAPVTLLWGPVASWNLIMLLAPVSAALAMFWLLDYLEIPAIPALIGGFLFGFSSYEIGQSLGHLNLVLIFPLPLLVLLTIKRLRGHIRLLYFVIGSVLLITFLLYTSIEISLTGVLSALGAVLLFSLWYRREFLDVLRMLAKDIIEIAVGVFVLTLPLLYYLLSGISIGGTVINSPYVYSTDLLNFVIPTPVTDIGSRLVSSISTSFTGNFSEESGYIGIIIVLLVVMAIVEGIRGRRWAVPFALWTAVLTVCTLGPVLHVDGNVTAIRLPWILPAHLPILKDILPSRLMIYVALSVAIWVPFWISWGSTKRAKIFRIAAALCGVIMMIPGTTFFFWVHPYIPLAVSNGELAGYVGSGSGVLVVPRGQALPAQDSHLGVLWSEASGFQLNTTIPPWGYNPYKAGFMRWPFSVIYPATDPPPGTASQLEIFCAVHHDTTVAVVPSLAPAWVVLLNRLGWQHHAFKGVTAYHVPKTIIARYSHVSAISADTAFYVPEVEAMKNAAACYLAHGGLLSSLTPDAAIADHCLNSAYASPTPSSNWTTESGWLGPQGSNVGIGIGATGAVAHQVFAGAKGASEFLLYDPNPHSVTLQAMAHDPEGTYLMVMTPGALSLSVTPSSAQTK